MCQVASTTEAGRTTPSRARVCSRGPTGQFSGVSSASTALWQETSTTLQGRCMQSSMTAQTRFGTVRGRHRATAFQCWMKRSFRIGCGHHFGALHSNALRESPPVRRRVEGRRWTRCTRRYVRAKCTGTRSPSGCSMRSVPVTIHYAPHAPLRPSIRSGSKQRPLLAREARTPRPPRRAQRAGPVRAGAGQDVGDGRPGD
jgi:hypothetical protein